MKSIYFCNHSVSETISLRLDAVEELIEKEELFYNIQSLLAKCLDIEHLISLSVQIPKQVGCRDVARLRDCENLAIF